MSRPEQNSQRVEEGEALAGGHVKVFFDIDGTLTEGFTILSFAQHLANAGTFDDDAWGRMQADLGAYSASDKGEQAYTRFAIDLVDHYAQGLAGKDVEEVHQEADRFFAQAVRGEIAGYNLCEFTEELAREMNLVGKTIAISGSPRESLLPLQRFLNLDELQATTIEESQGRFTGEVVSNMALASAKRIAVTSHLAQDVNTRKSFAFGDSIHDVPVLEAVGNPFVLGNNSHLQKYGNERGWSVISDPNLVVPAVRKTIALVFGEKK